MKNKNIASYASIFSIASFGSILSIGSSGSILSIGCTGSILSIGCFGSVCSIFSVFSVAKAFAFDTLGIWRAIRRSGSPVTSSILQPTRSPTEWPPRNRQN